MKFYILVLAGLITSYFISYVSATSLAAFIVMVIFLGLTILLGGKEYISSGIMDEK